MLRHLDKTEYMIGRKKSAVPKILEKGESFGDTLDSDMEEQQENESSDSEEKREKSIQRLRGILKRKITAGTIVRSIQFSMEEQDKIKNNMKNFDKKIKKKLRSPPPKEPSPILFLNKSSSSSPTKLLVHSASFYTFSRSKEDLRKTSSSPATQPTSTQERYSDSEYSDDDNEVRMQKHLKSRYAKLRLDTDGNGSIHKNAYEYELENAFDKIEASANEEIPIHDSGNMSRECKVLIFLAGEQLYRALVFVYG